MHTGAKNNILSRNSLKFDDGKMWILSKLRFWKCEFCQKWDFENVNFWMNWGFLPQCDIRKYPWLIALRKSNKFLAKFGKNHESLWTLWRNPFFSVWIVVLVVWHMVMDHGSESSIIWCLKTVSMVFDNVAMCLG